MSDPHHPLAAHRLARRVLIACEGQATERGYFEAIRRQLHMPPAVVGVLPQHGGAPRRLVQALLKARDQRRAEGSFDPDAGDTLWAVFDGDEHRRADPRGWREALALAEAEGVRLAVSNPCFELWYLLHFQDQFAPLDCAAALQALKRHLPRYTKNATLYPEPLATRTAIAIARAKRLEARAIASGDPAHANPGSGVFHLVAHLLALGRPAR
jgi:hypothetical protein